MKQTRTPHAIVRVREADPYEVRYHLEMIERRQAERTNGRCSVITGGVYHPHDGLFVGQNGMLYRIAPNRVATRIGDGEAAAS